MSDWVSISDLRMVPEFVDPKVIPDGRHAVAVDIYFKAQDARSYQLDALTQETLQRALIVIDGNDPNQALQLIKSGNAPEDANYWFYQYYQGELMRGVIYPPDDPPNHKNPPTGGGPNETPASEKDYQHIRIYVGCGVRAARHISLGVRIKPTNGQEYIAWAGASGDHHPQMALAIAAEGEPFDTRLIEGVPYYISPAAIPGTCVHPLTGGAEPKLETPLITYPEFGAKWAQWHFLKDPVNPDCYLIQNAQDGRLYAYLYAALAGWVDNPWHYNLALGHLPAQNHREYPAYQFQLSYQSWHPDHGTCYTIGFPYYDNPSLQRFRPNAWATAGTGDRQAVIIRSKPQTVEGNWEGYWIKSPHNVMNPPVIPATWTDWYIKRVI